MTTTKLVENVVSLEETKPTPEEPAVNEIIPEVVIDKPVTNDTVASVIVTNDTVIADEDIKEPTVSLKFQKKLQFLVVVVFVSKTKKSTIFGGKFSKYGA